MEVQRLFNTTWIPIATVPITQSSYTVTGLAANTNYSFRIRAVGPNGESLFGVTRTGKTQTLPPVPAAPSNLVAAAIGSNFDSLVWNDNSANETVFEVFKSVGNNTSYQLVGTVAGSAGTKGSFKDIGLFAHTSYWYKVRSKNAGGNSATYSNELQVTTTNSIPVMTPMSPFSLRFDEVKSFPLSASDADGDNVFFEGVNLPDFVSLFDYGDGVAELFIEPTIANQGVYENMEIRVIDGFGGVTSTIFSFEVNDNHSPVIDPFSNLDLNETFVLKTALTSTDADGDDVTWELSNVPSFITYAATANGDSLKLTVAPQETDAGSYVIGLKVKDGQDAYSLGNLNVQIGEFNPNFTVSVNFTTGTATSPSPWNNFVTAGAPVADTLKNLVNQAGALVENMAVILQTNWNGSSQSGGVPTGYNSGPYPYAVMNSYIVTEGREANSTYETIKISGLNPNNKYNFDFLSARNGPQGSDRRATFRINNVAKTVDALYNHNPSELVEFASIIPNAAGEIYIDVYAPTGSVNAALNAMVIESFFDGVLPPVAPSNFAVNYSENDDIRLTWTDNSGNEVGFDVFRSTDNETFTKIATVPANTPIAPSTVSFDDLNTTPFVTYFYTMRAFNGNGNSVFSDTLSIDGLNKAPIIATVPPIVVGENQSKTVQISATDPEGGTVYLMLENAPSFVTIQDVSNGVANLIITPSNGDTGVYPFNVIAMDEFGYFNSQPVTLTVSDFTETFVYVNFTRSTHQQGNPWNNVIGNTTGATQATIEFLDLKDNVQASTFINLKVNESWTGTNLNGGGSIYPTNVVTSAFFSQATTSKTITLSELKPGNLYDLSMFSSRATNDGTNRTTNFTANGSPVVSINATGNTSNLVQLNGIRPNAENQIVLTISRGTNSTTAVLNALVIREYTDNGLPTTPSNLTAGVMSRSSIRLNWVDQSSNETGFEIWKSVNDNQNFTLLTTTAPGVQTFTDNGLAQSTAYFYKVRAKGLHEGNTVYSPYTSEVEAKTFISSVSINFGAVAGVNGDMTFWGQSPWHNNFSVLQVAENAYYTPAITLNDDAGVNSGMQYYTVMPFSDDNTNGVNTGNNSGIVPDAVLRTAWYVDKGGEAIFRIEGLSFLNKYNIGLLGSRGGSETRIAIYTINGEPKSQNAANNSQNFVFFNNLSPDANGRITVSVKPQNDLVSLAYLNAMVIQVTTNSAPTPEQRMAEEARVGSASEIAGGMVVSPNPFTDHVVISAEGDKEIARVALMTGNGTSVYHEMPVHQAGSSHYVDFSNTSLSSGMYYLKVNFRDGSNKTVKLLRK
jgi:hypothetical protein